MTDTLEENIKKSEEIRETLYSTIDEISEYHSLPQEVKKEKIEGYRMLLDIRDNLTIKLNYYQNNVIIEQNKEIINNLNTLIRKDK
ncbi:MAG: hypothetical protein NTZ83_04825 [Candidatus Pacearchaeota archaeon]|nr:hypothetical protein [Candidatus Pacearchaeota archaeon]